MNATTTVRALRGRELLAAVSRDLTAWLTRRPLDAVRRGHTVIGHSGPLRTTVGMLLATELLAEGLMDASMLPPSWRAFHLLWMALLADCFLAFAATTKRRPHVLTATTLRLSAGPLGEVEVPLSAIAAVRRELTSAGGLGVRELPDRPGSLLCTVSGTADLTVEREPHLVRLPNGETRRTTRLHFAANTPATAHRLIGTAVRSTER
ncbi:hypothetical protein [Streptomyces sp. ICBB 8177]|uniref:hypothetical protein n=1 Tax=Streptomyces sp. ICBB 8177 TaxID=563922 RepID=UPI000D67C860|nr:hypothetical protein [Streptomyces sp. ICBB 8177]PWI45929.1 hypothetical protein CK485_01915 [Streptomyces sp. ICBB 8177]